MAAIRSILGDERSAIRVRHAATASVVAAAGLAAGMFLIFAGSELYEQSSQRVLWVLLEEARALGV